MRHAARMLCAALALLPQASGGLAAEHSATRRAVISIIIDDLGNHERVGHRAIRLPGAVACAVLPHTPYAIELAREAHTRKKEVLLHLPMESIDGREPGPGNLHSGMSPAVVATTLDNALQAVPHVVGVSSHMGSLLTTLPEPMRWLMRAIEQEGNLFFVDSRTTADSVAATMAREVGIAYLVRDVFLDRERDVGAIHMQFQRLMEIARKRGRALAIGHPYMETLDFLERRLPELADSGIELVPLSTMLASHNQEQTPWQASLSH